jgi:hypothetical protein
VAKFTQVPFPQIAIQAVHFVCWSFLVFGAFALQPLTDEDEDKGQEDDDVDGINSTNLWLFLEVTKVEQLW